MSLFNSNGKNATPGLPCLYHLTSGVVLFSETAKEDDDSYIFDGEKTLVVTVKPGKKQGEVSMEMVKMSTWGYKALQTRVFKAAVGMVQDTSEPAIIKGAKEALSGIILAGPGAN